MTLKELLESLGDLPDNNVNLPALAGQVSTGTGVVPFVGAGLSAPYNLPQWGEFIRDLAKREGLVDEVEKHLTDLQYEEAAELLQTRMRGRFEDLLEHHFGDQVLKDVEFRGAITWVPHVTVGPVITTNFDRLLEKVFDNAGCPFPIRVWHERVEAAIKSFSQNGLALLKLHGDWQFPSERVLTLSEYRRHYGDPNSDIDFQLPIPHLLELLVTRPVLFLGCSLKQDRTAKVITRLAARIAQFRHFAILAHPGTPAEYFKRIDELTQMNVRPIWYPPKQHAKIEEVLAWLAEQVPESLRLVKRKPPPETIPSFTNRFIGRELEQRELRDRIRKHRLVTVAGAPGAGKTRLTAQVAELLKPEFDAVWFVPLSQIPEAGAIPQRLAHTMQVKGQTAKDLLEVVAAILKKGCQLLILDNCETWLSECARIAKKLVDECPKLHIVLTSRVELGNAIGRGHEDVYRVPPLELPDPDHLPSAAELALIDSVELLLACVKGSFELNDSNALKVAQLCRRLDGLPLAVELVAAQLDMRSLDWVLKNWGEHLDFSGADDPGPEQQAATLRDTIRVSYDLLQAEDGGPRTCTLFRRLAVFHRGWTVESARVVCGEPGQSEKNIFESLKLLRRASLIEVEEVAGVKRYRYLDAIREFALRELSNLGDRETFSARHARWATAFAEGLAPDLLAERQAESLATLSADADNLRGAILWAKEQQDPETALRLTVALWRVMEIKGFYRDGCARLHMALGVPGAERFPVLRSKALSGLSVLAYRQGDLTTAEATAKESLKLERAHGTTAGIANALNDLGNVAQQRGKYHRALRLYRASLVLERANGNARGIGVGLFNCGRQSMNLGVLDDAVRSIKESLKMFEAAGNRREAAFALNSLGRVAHLQGKEQAALHYADRSLAIRKELGDQRGVADAQRTRAAVLISQREFGAALDLLKQSRETVCDIGDERGVAETLEHLAWLENAQESFAKATVLYAAAQEIRNRLQAALAPVERPPRDAQLEMARTALGEGTFAAEWDKGSWMSPKEAFELELGTKAQVMHAKQ